MQKIVTGMMMAGLVALSACDGSDDEVAAAPVAVADTCPAMAASTPPATPSATGAYLCAAGFGVADLDKAVTFYKALGMKETGRVTRADRQEVVLVSADDRGSRIILIKYTDGKARQYNRNPGKIVFYVKDATAFGAALAGAGGTLSAPPVAYQGRMVGFGRDLDNNLVEIASDAGAVHSYISAIGIGVTDLAAARTFYVDTMDMKVALYLPVTKTGAGGAQVPWYNEYILTSNANKGSAVVLMHYTDGGTYNYTDNPVKLSYGVNDTAAFATRLDGKATVSRAPAAATEAGLGGVNYGVAKDADGTTLEFYKAAN